MNTIDFSSYTPSLSDKASAEGIFVQAMDMNPEMNEITFDLKGLEAMTTLCAKLIFGQIYVKIGPQKFTKNIKFKNMAEPIDLVIRMGITRAISEQ